MKRSSWISILLNILPISSFESSPNLFLTVSRKLQQWTWRKQSIEDFNMVNSSIRKFWISDPGYINLNVGALLCIYPVCTVWWGISEQTKIINLAANREKLPGDEARSFKDACLFTFTDGEFLSIPLAPFGSLELSSHEFTLLVTLITYNSDYLPLVMAKNKQHHISGVEVTQGTKITTGILEAITVIGNF